MDMTCAILAGGRSRRMGRDKATLKIGEQALIESVYRKAKEIFSDIIIISSRHTSIRMVNAPVLKDLVPLEGPLAGIVSALLYSPHPYVCVLACDMPFVSTEAISYLISQVNGEDVIIPKTDKGYEPLHAIYNRSCISYMLSHIERGRLRTPGIFPYLAVRELGEHPSFFVHGVASFTNINTEGDLSLAKRLVR
jgi:molybdopterin-guanine dinucleotide biosynthesis protein A